MKNLTDWLNTNKISLNMQKTELVIFKHLQKMIDSEVKIKLSRKQLYSTDSVKYYSIRTDENLNHVNDIAIKLNRTNALFFKIMNFFNVNTLKLSTMQTLAHMLIMPKWFGLRILMP